MNSEFTTAARNAVATGGYTLYSTFDILQRGVTAVSGLPIDEGDASISVDGTAISRRQLSMSMADALSYLPLSPLGLLSPFLSEIRVWVGVKYANGTVDKWPVFTGPLTDPEAADTVEDVSLKITASDRAQAVSDRRLPTVVTYAAGTTSVAAIQNLIQRVYPTAEFIITSFPSNPTLPDTVIDELEDPMQHASDIAQAAGGEVFCDGMGRFVIRPIPDPSLQAPVWNLNEGATSILKGIDQRLSATDSYSHAIAASNPTDGTAPLRADAYDTDILSPTYYDPANNTTSAFGDRPVKLASDLIRDQTQCNAAAIALLNRKKGAVENLSLTIAPLTALEEWDVVAVTQTRLGISSNYTLESFTIPLTPEADMPVVCRSRKL